MLELKKSGLPLYLNESNFLIAISAPLMYEGYGEKNAVNMKGLLYDEEKLNLEERFYDVYRGIRYAKDYETFNKDGFRYDITVIMGGLVNSECKKTSGHYHGYNQKRTNTYAEVYEVIKGRALYILQRADNFDKNPNNIDIEDIILVTVEEGESIIIPPNYGHCSINIGNGVLIFSNLAYIPCPVCYEPVKNYHGMGFYILKSGKDIIIIKNERYKKIPKAKFASVKENVGLGIVFNKPVYKSYIENRQTFRFLAEPDDYIDEIMSMLVYKNNL